MATLLSPEIIKHMRTLCESFNITKSSSQANKKHRVSLKLSEISKGNSGKENKDFWQKLKSWILSLNMPNLQSVLYHCNVTIATILIQMHIHKSTYGNINFAMVTKLDRKLQEFDLKNLFCMKKESNGKTLKKIAEDHLEKNLRFFDTEEYCDSIGVDLKGFVNVNELLKVFDTISDGNAFKVPCKAFWSNHGKKWLFEYPAWLNPHGYNSLAAWACASFERDIWMHYWKSCKVDPRAFGETQNFDGKEVIDIEPADTQSVFVYYKTMQESTRIQVVGDHSLHKNIFTEVKKKISEIAPGKISDFCGPANADFYFTMNSQKNFQSFLSLELIPSWRSEDFIFISMMSPLNRIGSIFDIVLRVLASKIKDDYYTKITEELYLQTDLEMKPKQKKKPNKKSKPQKKKNREVAEKEDFEGTQVIVKGLVDKIFANFYNSLSEVLKSPQIEINDSEFQVVNQRKNKRPQPQQRPHNLASDMAKAKSATRARPMHRKNKPIPHKSKKAKLWECPKVPSSILSSDADFPPLSSPINNFEQYDTLHHEILRFSTSTIRKVQEKSKYIFLILERISALVSDLLGGLIQLYGSYATNLAIDSSDIDLAVYGIEFQNRENLQQACISLAGALEILPFVISCKAIVTAKIPVIKVHADMKIFSKVPGTEMIDITLIDHSAGMHFGLEAISFTRDLLILFPHIQCLAIVLKNFLYSSNLNSAYHGKFIIRWVKFL